MTPKRRPNETRSAFIERFLTDPGMAEKFPEEGARRAAADIQSRRRPKRHTGPALAYRSLELRAPAAKGEGDRTVESLVATETPVVRRTWDGTEFEEILLCGEENVDLSFFGAGRAPVLANHSTWDQIGVVTSATVAEGELRATEKFSRSPRGEQELQDIRDGIRPNVSVGYDILKARFVLATDPGARDTLVVERWRPMEMSHVSIPADEATGVGRSGEGAFPEALLRKARSLAHPIEPSAAPPTEPPTPVNPPAPAAVVESPQEAVSAAPDSTPAPVAVDRGAQMSEPTPPAAPAPTPTPAPVQVHDNGAAERARCAEILAVGDAHNLQREAREAVAKGTSVAEFQSAALKVWEQRQRENATPVFDLHGKDKARYSIANVARAVAAGKWGMERSLEREVHDHMAKIGNMDVKDSRFSVFVPHNLLGRAPTIVGNPGTPPTGTGGDLVGSSQFELQPFLTAGLALVRAGVRVLTGLRGEVHFPAGLAYPGASTPGENPNSGVTPTATTFRGYRANSKPVRAATYFSKEQLNQGVPAIDMLVEETLQTAIREKLEEQMFLGNGASGELLGIDQRLDDESIADVLTGAAVTYPNFDALPAAIDDRQAMLPGQTAYITTRKVISKGLTTNRLGSSSAVPVILGVSQDQWSIDGDPVFRSHKVKKTYDNADSPAEQTAHGVYYGVWDRLFLCMFGPAMEILIDPFKEADKGNITFWIYQGADLAIPVPEVIAKGSFDLTA